MTINLEQKLKLDAQKAYNFVKQNNKYLSNNGILNGNTTLQERLEDFYGLKYYDEGIDEELEKEQKEKYGQIPTEMLDILINVVGFPENTNECLQRLEYKNVRESFEKNEFPRSQELSNKIVGLISFFGGILTGFYSMDQWSAGNYYNSILNMTLVFFLVKNSVDMMIKNANDKHNFFEENLERIKTYNLFWELHRCAQIGDVYVKKYKSICELPSDMK